MQECISENDKK